MAFTLLDGTTAHEIDATVTGEGVRITASDVQATLGWKLEPQGLCRGSVCIPVRDRERLVHGDSLDLETLAELIDRPLALDTDENVAALGDAAAARRAQQETLEAPDFQLPDLDGKLHSLSEHRGKKVLLIDYASW